MKEERIGHFLSVSFVSHLLILFLLSLLASRVYRSKTHFIEVSLIKMTVGRISARAETRIMKPKMLPGISYPFRMESPSPPAASLPKGYTEPVYTPVSSVYSHRPDLSIAGVKKELKPEVQGLSGLLKKGSDLPSGHKDTLEFQTTGFGIAGPAAGRGILYFEYPAYPEWAERKGLESKVKLKFWISPDGYVDEVFVEQRGNLQLDNIAIQSLKKWRFEPLPALSVRAKRARQWGTIEMIFKLQ